jgi:DNA-directed RNA polymerase specialized sigma24 family protein
MSEQFETRRPANPASAPPPAVLLAAAPPPGKTALDLAVEQDRQGELTKFLYFSCHKRGVRGADAEDAVSKTFVIAFRLEREGKCWDPKERAATLHLGWILVNNVLRSRLRTLKRRREDPMGEDGEPAGTPSRHVASAEEDVAERQEKDRLASEVQSTLQAQTNEGLTLRILDAMREGISGHENLASHLSVTVTKINAAFRRIKRRVDKVYGEGGRGAS